MGIEIRQPQDACSRIEEAAHTGSCNTVNIFLQRSPNDRIPSVIRNNPGRCQMTQTGFPCLLHGAVASQHGNGFEMADPCKVRPFAEQKFTAPHGSVRTGTGTVEAHRQGLPCQVMLCHHRQGMGVVVLHLIKGQPATFRKVPPPYGGGVARMQIGNDSIRFNVQKLYPVGYCFFKKSFRLFQGNVTGNLRRKKIPVRCKAEPGFHFRANCQNIAPGENAAGILLLQLYGTVMLHRKNICIKLIFSSGFHSNGRFRHIALGPAQQLRPAQYDTGNPIIGRAQDFPVVGKQ